MFNRNKVIWSDEVGSISIEKAASAVKSKPKKLKKVAETKVNWMTVLLAGSIQLNVQMKFVNS